MTPGRQITTCGMCEYGFCRATHLPLPRPRIPHVYFRQRCLSKAIFGRFIGIERPRDGYLRHAKHQGVFDMSNTQDNLTGLSDEALDPVPAQEASACGRACGTIYCNISDETLDTPEQQAMPCACGFLPRTISDWWSTVSSAPPAASATKPSTKLQLRKHMSGAVSAFFAPSATKRSTTKRSTLASSRFLNQFSCNRAGEILSSARLLWSGTGRHAPHTMGCANMVFCNATGLVLPSSRPRLLPSS